MSWARVYRVAMHLLPDSLRHKHGPAMQALFAREVERARATGQLHVALTGLTGIGDVIRRAAYELVRPGRVAVGQRIVTSCSSHPPVGELLRRLATSFAIAFVTLTAMLLALFARKQVAELSARGAPAATLAHVVLLAVPFIAAMTIPMAVLVAVLREFTRLGADGTLDLVRRQRHGLRRLVLPVLAGAAVVAGLALVETAEVVPRANARLVTMLTGRPAGASARAMTLGELREAERTARSRRAPVERQSAAIYEVEIQKKFALAAACFVLAFAGVAIALRIPRGGVGLVMGASCAVFWAYYLLIVTGESLANQLVISPVVGMWGANVVMLALALLAIGRRRVSKTSGEGGAVIIDA